MLSLWSSWSWSSLYNKKAQLHVSGTGCRVQSRLFVLLMLGMNPGSCFSAGRLCYQATCVTRLHQHLTVVLGAFKALCSACFL